MGLSEFGRAPGTIPSIRTDWPSGNRTMASPETQYLIAAGGSLPGEPKLPWPSTKG